MRIDGLLVASWKDDDGSLAKVRAALELIRTHDRRRYDRLVKDLRGIWVILLPGALAQFSSDDYFCELDLRHVKSTTPQQLAATIVHEATHARLWRRGIRYDEGLRARVEAICFRQERVFATRFPPSESATDALDRYADLTESYFSDASMTNRHTHGMIAVLREMNAPRWVTGIFLRRYRRQSRRDRIAARARDRSPSA